jgi:predicted nucleotidyltransferase
MPSKKPSKKLPVSAVPKDFRDMLGLLVSCDVEFLLIGGVAFAAYGEPRATKDMDLWVNPTPANARRLFKALAEFGAPTHGAKPADFSSPGTFLQLGTPPVRIDLITAIDGVVFADAWPRRVVTPFAGTQVPVISLDDLIANKKAAGRKQDLLDVKQILKMAKAVKKA